MNYVTETYDFHTALSKQYADVVIDDVRAFSHDRYLIKANVGSFICESFGGLYDGIWMKVYKVVE